MKKTLAFGLAGLSLGVAPALHAQEVGRVISSVPVIQQVQVPRQVCSNQQVMVEQPRSGAGAVLGAVAGGAVGNAIGHGTGRALATGVGLLAGAMLGNQVEGPNTQVQNQTQCTTQVFLENRAVGYNVTYEYAGRQYTVQMPQDPGPTVRLQVVPVGAAGAPVQSPAQSPGQPLTGAEPAVPTAPATVVSTPIVSAPVHVQPAVVVRDVVAAPTYYAAPAYYPAPVYYPAPGYYRPWYPGISLSLGYVHRSHSHRR